MHVQWNRRQLRSNRQLREILCPHDTVERPWLISPVLVHYEAGHFTHVWYPGPTVRECCIEDRSGFALAAWWWEVEQRFQDLKQQGLADQDVADQLLEQAQIIRMILSERVPRPSEAHRKIYLEYREEMGVTRRRVRNRTPQCFGQLGLPWPCTKDALSKRWRELALQHHPDRGGSLQMFIEAKTAYSAAMGVLERATARS